MFHATLLQNRLIKLNFNFKNMIKQNIVDVYDFDDKMALINCDRIHEYAVKIDAIVSEDTQLEDWIKMKLTIVEQNVADVKHSLSGWAKFESGGIIFKKELLHIAKYSKDLIDMIKSGAKLMSWQENKLAISAEHIDNIYHHLDYKMGNRASDLNKDDVEEITINNSIEYKKGGGVKKTVYLDKPMLIEKDLDGFYSFDFDYGRTTGWAFDTDDIGVAICIMLGSKYGKDEKIRDLEINPRQLRDADKKEMFYWLSGGNRSWRFDSEYNEDFDTIYDAIWKDKALKMKRDIVKLKTIGEVMDYLEEKYMQDAYFLYDAQEHGYLDNDNQDAYDEIQAAAKEEEEKNDDYIESYTKENYINKDSTEVISELVSYFEENDIDYDYNRVELLVKNYYTELSNKTLNMFEAKKMKYAKGGGVESEWTINFTSDSDYKTKYVKASSESEAINKGFSLISEDGEDSDKYSVENVYETVNGGVDKYSKDKKVVKKIKLSDLPKDIYNALAETDNLDNIESIKKVSNLTWKFTDYILKTEWSAEEISNELSSNLKKYDVGYDDYYTLTISTKQGYAKGGGVGKMYYHILEYGDYGKIGYQGHYDTFEEAKKQVERLKDYFPKMDFQVFPSNSRKEPPITTMARGGGVGTEISKKDFEKYKHILSEYEDLEDAYHYIWQKCKGSKVAWREFKKQEKLTILFEENMIKKYGKDFFKKFDSYRKMANVKQDVEMANGGNVEFWFSPYGGEFKVESKGTAKKIIEEHLAKKFGADSMVLVGQDEKNYIYELNGNPMMIAAKTAILEEQGLDVENYGRKKRVYIPKEGIDQTSLQVRYPLITPFKNGGEVSEQELMVKNNLVDGEISSESLKQIVGCELSYPYQIVGAIKLEKCFMRPYYKL